MDKNQNVKSNNPDRVEHGLIAPHDALKESGKDVHNVNSPVVSTNPTSENQQKVTGFKLKNASEFKTISKATFFTPLEDWDKSQNPWHSLEAGSGMFVPLEPNTTTDDLMGDLRKKISKFNERNSIIETDENGDEIRDQVLVETRKRTGDGFVQLEGGKPIVGASQKQPYKRLYFSRYAVKAVAKGDVIGDGQKAPGDGAFVIRVT